jgi:hypothetical protein
MFCIELPTSADVPSHNVGINLQLSWNTASAHLQRYAIVLVHTQGGRIMRSIRVAAAALGLTVGILAAAPASAWNRGNVQVLTVLPELLNQPGVKSSVEGLTVGPDGNIYVPTFGFNTQGATSGPANLFVISPNGKLVRQVAIANSSPHMLGLAFTPVTPQKLLAWISTERYSPNSRTAPSQSAESLAC